ncbi:unnamed protein product, partial [Meganyctiphanes norvegica]
MFRLEVIKQSMILQFPNINMHTKGHSIVFLFALTVIFSVGVRGQDPHDYFGQNEFYDEYNDVDINEVQEDDSTVMNDDETSDSSSSQENNELNPEKLIQKIDVSNSSVTIFENVDMRTRVDARGSNISIQPMTSVDEDDLKDLENQTVINKPDLNLNGLGKVIENGINALDIKISPWVIEDPNNPQDPGKLFNDRLRGLQNGLDALVDTLKDIAGKLVCEEPGLCSAPFTKVRTGECLYINLENRKTWADAREYCQSLGADLAEPVSIKQDLEYIMRLSGTAMINMGRDRLWIGASDQDEEGVWRWVSGSQVA